MIRIMFKSSGHRDYCSVVNAKSNESYFDCVLATMYVYFAVLYSADTWSSTELYRPLCKVKLVLADILKIDSASRL